MPCFATALEGGLPVRTRPHEPALERRRLRPFPLRSDASRGSGRLDVRDGFRCRRRRRRYRRVAPGSDRRGRRRVTGRVGRGVDDRHRIRCGHRSDRRDIARLLGKLRRTIVATGNNYTLLTTRSVIKCVSTFSGYWNSPPVPAHPPIRQTGAPVHRYSSPYARRFDADQRAHGTKATPNSESASTSNEPGTPPIATIATVSGVTATRRRRRPERGYNTTSPLTALTMKGLATSMSWAADGRAPTRESEATSRVRSWPALSRHRAKPFGP